MMGAAFLLLPPHGRAERWQDQVSDAHVLRTSSPVHPPALLCCPLVARSPLPPHTQVVRVHLRRQLES